MGKKEPIRYTVEREFLSKLSVEELLIRIIKSHLKIQEKRWSDVGKHGKTYV